MEKQYRRLSIAKNMPELHHTFSGHKYDSKKSEVLKWLFSQPEIINYVFEKVRKKGYVIFDSEKGTWKGVDYDNTIFYGNETANYNTTTKENW